MSDLTQPEGTTIVAVATPPGRGGVGIVRLSGAQAFSIAERIVASNKPLRPRIAHYRVLRDESQQRIDDALVTCFPAPHSYTGEDVVEIATHGAPVVLDWLVRACVGHGAELARAGEFTERAYLGGRLDLTGAEAVRDLVEAQTLAQVRLAAEQMGGSIAMAVRPVKQHLLELIAALEAGIDFAEDDISTMQQGELSQRIHSLVPPVAALLATFAHGRVLREGLRVALVGEPNVGKSSLFNALVEQDRAIVTAVPGTTRDIVSERIAVAGIPIELLDTAGLRETSDEVERIGVAKSKQAIAEADAVLIVVDAADPVVPADHEAYGSLVGRPVLVVENKIDLLTGNEPAADTSRSVPLPAAWPSVRISTRTGAGLMTLRQAIRKLALGDAQQASGATLTNLRQKEAVGSMHQALMRAQRASAQHVPHEMVLLDLYEALHRVDELTGETTADDVLNLIFSTFCIGK